MECQTGHSQKEMTMQALDVQDRGGRHKIAEAADQSKNSNDFSDIFRIQSLPQGMRSKCIHKAMQKLFLPLT